MNWCIGQSCNPPSVSLWLICSWNILKPRLSTQPPIHQGCGLGMLMTLFVIQKEEHSNQFLQHINFIDSHIQFTQETPNTDDSIPFLGTLVSPRLDNTLVTTVYVKPANTDQHFHCDGPHNLSSKCNMFNTLTYRDRKVLPNLNCYTRKRST